MTLHMKIAGCSGKPKADQQIKIMHVISGLNVGGAEGMLLRLVCAMSEHTHVIVTLSTAGPLARSFSEKGILVHALGMRTPLSIPGALFRLLTLMRRERPDIVQTWMVHADLIGGLVAKAVGIPLAWGVRTTDYNVESRRTRFVHWLCTSLSAIIPDKIVCAAQASLELSRQTGYDAQKLLVIPNGFDVEALRRCAGKGYAVRTQAGLSERDVVVGCMGRYNPAKDHANFVRAAALLAADYPACRFLMVGKGLDATNGVLANLIASTGFPDRFVLLGERSDPAVCLDAMDVFVLSSCTEGFPNVLGEAMVMGVPCVTTDVGDAAMLLGDAGEVVPARNSVALAAAVARLLDMPAEQRQMLGNKGRERVEREFSMVSAARNFASLYEDMIARHRRKLKDAQG